VKFNTRKEEKEKEKQREVVSSSRVYIFVEVVASSKVELNLQIAKQVSQHLLGPWGVTKGEHKYLIEPASNVARPSLFSREKLRETKGHVQEKTSWANKLPVTHNRIIHPVLELISRVRKIF